MTQFLKIFIVSHLTLLISVLFSIIKYSELKDIKGGLITSNKEKDILFKNFLEEDDNNFKIEKFTNLSLINSSFIPSEFNNTKNKNYSNIYNITGFGVWDDVAALGLWFMILLVFGPTAVIAVVVFLVCKNVIMRSNRSPLLG